MAETQPQIEATTTIEMTRRFLECQRCPQDFGNGDGVLRRATIDGEEYWVPPRGWAGSTAIGPRPIVVVAHNPGAPSHEELKDLRTLGVSAPSEGGEVPTSAARFILDYVTSMFVSPERNAMTIYHRKVVGYVRMALWLLREADADYANLDPLQGDWRDLAWITDAYKCSTWIESGPRIPKHLRAECVRRHFAIEVGRFQPRVLLALGGPAASALRDAGHAHVTLRHPSNGCPRCDDESHDSALAQVAELLGHADGLAVATSLRFREFRRELQDDLFG